MHLSRRLHPLLRLCRNLIRLDALNRAAPPAQEADAVACAPARMINSHVAAIPIRWTGRGAEVMLVTTRGSGRWIVPKGGRLDNARAWECAAREAFEEAGVVGRIEPYPLGAFEHRKRSKHGAPCFEIAAYVLHVAEVLSDWPERGVRKRAWFAPEVAARLTGNEALAALIREAASTRFADAPPAYRPAFLN